MATDLISEQEKRRLEDIRTGRVDLVDRGANKKRFLIIKRESLMPETGAEFFAAGNISKPDDTASASVEVVAKAEEVQATQVEEAQVVQTEIAAPQVDIAKSDGIKLEISEDAKVEQVIVTSEAKESTVENIQEATVEVQKSEPSYREILTDVFTQILNQSEIIKSDDANSTGISQVLSPVAFLAEFENRLTALGYIEKKIDSNEASQVQPAQQEFIAKTIELATANGEKLNEVVATIADVAKQLKAVTEQIGSMQIFVAKSHECAVPERAGASEHTTSNTSRLPASLLWPPNFNDPEYKAKLQKYGVKY